MRVWMKGVAEGVDEGFVGEISISSKFVCVRFFPITGHGTSAMCFHLMWKTQQLSSVIVVYHRAV